MGRHTNSRLVELLEQRRLLTAAIPDLQQTAELASTDQSDYLVLFEDQSATSSTTAELETAHRQFAHQLEHLFGEPILVRYEYTNALNGLALSLTATQADQVASLPGVSSVIADAGFALQQNSAELTGAPGVWDGTALAGVDGTFGEGVLVGIIDSGIDFDNPSFAATGPIDGYVHSNPFGEGTYLGVCDPSHPDHDPAFACNDKIVGAYDFTDDTQINDPNFADHGTSVAGIAAGNFVNVTIPGTSSTDEISGVAPHANLISYDVCDSTDNCSSIAIVAAVDQAIEDGVDVLNMSIGGPTESPWSGVMAQAMWNAENAGIFVAVSAGNQGPGEGSITAPADAPWVTAVAATDSSVLTTVHVDAVGTSVPDSLLQISAIRGENLSIDSTLGPAPIVHVADVAGDHLASSALPAESLTGHIALIDRGESLFETKVQNAFNAGAIGVIMVNNVDGPSVTMSGVSDIPIPSVMISRDDGLALRQWMQQTPNAQIRINAQEESTFTTVAGFSSRGANGQTDTLTPQIAAPGADTSVIAPTATTGTDDWDYFSGTSAASPHIAGSAALLTALHPTWTPSEIQSALQTTATNTNIVTGASLRSATAFDIGSGQVDVATAANAGIVLNETSSEFTRANPASGGDGSTLNLASFVDSNVDASTTWSRTLRSTQDTSVTWTPVFTADSGLTLTLDAHQIVLPPGEEAAFQLTAQIVDATTDDWLFGELTLVPDQDLPEAHFPVAVKPTPVAGVIVQQSGSGTDSSENGSIDDYQIRLQTNPNGLVQIRVEAPPDLEVSADGIAFASSINLAINDAFPRTVSVRAIDDDRAESTQTASITHRIFETSNSQYPVGFAIDDVAVRVVDNDLGTLALELDELILPEGSGTATATVTRSANSELTQPLTVTIADTEGLVFQDSSGNQIRQVPIAANQMAATFTVSAINNSFIDGDRNRSVVVSAASYDSSQQTVAVIDDDFASVKTIESSGVTIVSRTGTTDSFTAEIRTQPESDVIFDVVSSNVNAVSVSTSRLTFTPANWNIPQNVVVTGLDDSQTGLATVDVQITIVADLSDSSYANVQPAVVTVDVTDGDTSVPTIIAPMGRTLSNEPIYRWSAVEGAESFDLFVERVGTTGNPIIDLTAPGTSFHAPEQSIGAYRFWVRANYLAGGSSRWVTETYQVTTAPEIDPLPQDSSDTQPTITWAEVSGAEHYQVFISNRTTGDTVTFQQNVTSNEFTPTTEFTFGLHRIWVRAVGAASFNADWSAPVDYLIGPSLLGPLQSTFDRRPGFTWTSVAEATQYDLYIRQPDGSALEATVAATNFQPANDLATGRHTWWIRGVSASGARGPWTSAGVTYIGGRTDLLTPAATSNDAAPLFTWDPVLGAEEYELFLNRTDVPEHILFDRVPGTSWQSTVLEAGDYTAWVRPISDRQQAGIWSPAHKFTITQAAGQLTTEATSPQLVSFSNTPTLTWAEVNGAASYDVFVHDGVTGQQHTQLTNASFTLPDAGENTVRWWVRVVDEFGGVGPWSPTATVDTTGRAIAHAPNTQLSAITLRWTDVVGADRYILQVDNLTTGQTQVIREDQLTSNSYTLDSSLEPAEYRFWVRAIRNASASEGFWSVPIDFVVG